VDEFVLFDDVQYTRRDWRNRNRIMTPEGPQWLSIPVNVKGRYTQLIKDVMVSDDKWRSRHWKTIESNYAKAKHFRDYKEEIRALYLENDDRYLSDINVKFIKFVNQKLGIKTKLRYSGEFELLSDKTERLLSICEQCNASVYVSGPAAQEYFDEELAKKKGIAIEWFDYSGYPQYQQMFEPFEHAVSILDLLLNEGPDATSFMKSFH